MKFQREISGEIVSPLKSDIFIVGLSQQLSKRVRHANNVTIAPVDSVRNLGVHFHKSLTSYSRTSAFSKLLVTLDVFAAL